MDSELIKTNDGSPTLYIKELNENYHSIHGAVTESNHVFIKTGLEYIIEKNTTQSKINILEIGLGTYLNAYLSFERIINFYNNKSIAYCGIEKYPLSEKTLNEFYSVLNLIHKIDFDLLGELLDNSHNNLQVILDDILTYNFGVNKYDLIYYDAFAPNKQPELWTIDVFKRIAESQVDGGVLVTYCAKGEVKRNLKAVGYMVEGVEGPPGKREMIRATKS